MWLADKMGIERSHIAAIGDYYNDWDMLKTVGFPHAQGRRQSPFMRFASLKHVIVITAVWAICLNIS